VPAIPVAEGANWVNLVRQFGGRTSSCVIISRFARVLQPAQKENLLL